MPAWAKRIAVCTILSSSSALGGVVRAWASSLSFSSRRPATADKAARRGSSVLRVDQDRDTHLRGPDFFDIESHPTMTFESSDNRENGEGTYVVDGILS